VLALHALSRYPELISGRVVCLGSPLLDTAAGRQFSTHRLGRVFVGNTLSQAVFKEPLPGWSGPQEVGAIAGTRRLGLGQLVTKLQAPHDGVVELAETRLPGLTDHLALPVSHVGMLFSSAVATAAAGFFRAGCFISKEA